MIIKMPRIKQAPKKNPRDIPNLTNWASNLRNKHCKYFYLIYAPGQMYVALGWVYFATRWMYSATRWI